MTKISVALVFGGLSLVPAAAFAAVAGADGGGLCAALCAVIGCC